MTAPSPRHVPFHAGFSARAIAVDTETARFDRAMMAPPIVCLQWGTPDGEHSVVLTDGVRDALVWIFTPGNFDQIWLHNGGYDIACILEWYPDLTELVLAALDACVVLDTMWLQRMIQIARGDAGGPLALDETAQMYGLPPPTKEIEVQGDDGATYDVRRSFHLWYGADAIPEPWHSYADYDGVVTIQLAKRQCERWCTPAPGQKYATVNLRDVAEMTRKYVCLQLSSVYGLRVNGEAVEILKGIARGALLRLRQNALELNLIRPDPATRKDVARGLAADRFCPVRYERRPAPPLDPKKLATFDQAKLDDKIKAWEKRQAKHKNCPGCRWQARDEVTGELLFTKNTDVLKALVIKAYDGKPPITEPKKGKDGKKTGGGNISTSRDTLQDSNNPELIAWSQYNEFGTLMSKDMKIFANSPVHTRFGLANTTRPTSSDPNILNFRRTSFYVARCPNPACGYEDTLDPNHLPKPGQTLPCPVCEVPAAAEDE